MINLENIAEIILRHQNRLSVTDDPTEKCTIENKPFGGTHILFTGDLWQLQAIGGNQYNIYVKNYIRQSSFRTGNMAQHKRVQ